MTEKMSDHVEGSRVIEPILPSRRSKVGPYMYSLFGYLTSYFPLNYG